MLIGVEAVTQGWGFFIHDIMNQGNKFATVPASILYDQELKDAEVRLLLLINNLSGVKGYCWATNGYLGDKLNKSGKRIGELIKGLREKGYINSVLELHPTGEVKHRFLYVQDTKIDPPPKNRVTSPEESGDKELYKYNYKGKSDFPSREEFNTYLKQTETDRDPEWLWQKMLVWRDNGWCDLNGKPIKRWKGKIRSQFQYAPQKSDPYNTKKIAY